MLSVLRSPVSTIFSSTYASKAATLCLLCKFKCCFIYLFYFHLTYLEQFPYGDMPLMTLMTQILVDVGKQHLWTMSH